jgi:hypothetical protein
MKLDLCDATVSIKFLMFHKKCIIKFRELFYYKCTQILHFVLVEYSSRGSNKKAYEVLVSESHQEIAYKILKITIATDPIRHLHVPCLPFALLFGSV